MKRLKRQKNRAWLKAALKVSIFLGVALCSLGMIGAFGFLIYMNQGLPAIDSLKNYRPKEVSQVFSNEGEIIGEFFEERRIVQKEIPEMIKNAFIAAEDNKFWTHPGVDFLGIMRAFYKNMIAGGIKQGASTITQQVARGFLLSAERTMTRKVKEIILAWKIEKSLSKDEIIHLYLNHIYLGRSAYGVGAAAEVYFGKKLNEVTVAEAAILAGLPQAPSRYNPQKNPDRVKRRQLYVLRQMRNENFIDEKQYEEAANADVYISPRRDINKEVAPYFVEYIRQQIMKKYGDRMVLQDGLRIYTTLDLEKNRAAENALRTGLSALEERQGYRGPKKKLKFESEMESYFEGRKFDELEKEGVEADQNMEVAQADAKNRGRIMMKPRPPVEVGDFIEGIVVKVDDEKGEAFVEYEPGFFARILMADMKWAKRRTLEDDEESYSSTPEKPSQVVQIGDVIQMTVKLAKSDNAEAEKVATVLLGKSDRHRGLTHAYLLEARLEQATEVEGAVLAIDPRTGFVVTMVGGFDFERSQFNRTLQAKRQPGSAFKPVVYTAALDLGFTPASILQDTPITFENAIDETNWRPNNYDGSFEGDITLRTSLLKSKNIPTIRLLNEIGLDAAISYARRLGITSDLTRDFTMALGSSVVTLDEILRPYIVFATGGYPRDYIFIKRIDDRDGVNLEKNVEEDFDSPPISQIDNAVRDIKEEVSKVVFSNDLDKKKEEKGASFLKDSERVVREELGKERAKPPLYPGQVLSSETTFLITHLLKENVLFGSGRRSREGLKRPAAGKTGTTDDNKDAWFIGFTPELVAGVWVGYDDQRRLGRQETGSSAAVPIWTDFMAAATQGTPQKDFEQPANIEFARIDPKNGGPATAKTKGAVFEAFIKGTVPTKTPDSKTEPLDLYQKDL